MMRERRGLRFLKMRESRHNGAYILVRYIRQSSHKHFQISQHVGACVFDEYAHIERDLVVTAASRMQFFARLAYALGEQALDVHMDVLVALRERNGAAFYVAEYATQARYYSFAFLPAYNAGFA
jgi:hypothetical protein